jgi:hypothetical protein
VKDRRRELNLYQLFAYQGGERHLVDRAAKGWRRERIGTYFWQYRRAEPAQVSYAVTYVSDGSLFNPRPTENQERLDELCAAAGWEKVGDWAQMQIFVSERPDPVPLETEDAVRIQAIHRSMRKNFLPSNFVLLALPLLWLLIAWSNFRRDKVDFFSSSTDLFLVLLSILLLVLQGVNLSAYYCWRRRSLAAVARGGGCASTGGCRWFNLAALGSLAAITAAYLVSLLRWQRSSIAVFLLFLLAYGGILFLVLRTRDGLKRAGAPRRLNITLTLLMDVVLAMGLVSLLTFGVLRLGWFTGEGDTYLYQGQEWQTDPPAIPLTAEDLTGIHYAHIRRWDLGSGSFLMSRHTYSESARQDAASGDVRYHLSYTVTRTGIARLYDLVLEDTMANDDPDFWTVTWQPSDPAPWGAEAVWRRYLDGSATDTWLLCWPGQIAELELDGEPDGAQMAVAGAALAPAGWQSAPPIRSPKEAGQNTGSYGTRVLYRKAARLGGLSAGRGE